MPEPIAHLVPTDVVEIVRDFLTNAVSRVGEVG
jgi:hypothetical protein